MFGFGKKGVTDQEMWTLAIRVGVAMTAEEEVSRKVVGQDRATDFINRECKALRLRPTDEQTQYVRSGAQALTGTELTRLLMKRWLLDKRVSITQKDVADASRIIDASVQEFLKVDSERLFMETMAGVSSLSGTERATVAYGVAFSWKAFNVNFKSVENFKRQPLSVKAKFLEGLQKMQVKMAEEGDTGVSLGISLTTMFVVACMDGDGGLINRMSDQLEPLNREGFRLLV